MKVEFNYGPASMRKRNHLPHLDVDGGIYFVTYCLHDALTPAFLERHSRLREDLTRAALGRDGTLSICDARTIERILMRDIFGELDDGQGSCLLADPRVAEVVAQSFEFHDGERYRLYAYCVMPSHVHVSFRAQPGWPWWKTVGGWKSYTAKRANAIVRREGPLWQHDNFDRLVRDNRHLGRVVDYIARNPEKAGLTNWPWMKVLIGPPYLE